MLKKGFIVFMITIFFLAIASIANYYGEFYSPVEEQTASYSNIELNISSTNGAPITHSDLSSLPKMVTLNAPENYNDDRFLYWIDEDRNDKILAYGSNYTFMLNRTRNIQAVYGPKDDYLITFLDFNFDVLSSTGSLSFGENDIPSEDDLTIKPGYNFIGWSEDLSTLGAIEDDTFVRPVYEKHWLHEFDIMIDGQFHDTSFYDESFTISAPSAPEGEVFSHWEINGQVVSFEETFTLQVMQSIDLVPVYHSDPLEQAPLAYISEEVFSSTFQNGPQLLFNSRYELPESYTRLETGLIYYEGQLEGSLDFQTEGAQLIPSTHQMPHHGFASGIKTANKESYYTVRAYVVYEDGAHNEGYTFSDQLVYDTLMPSETINMIDNDWEKDNTRIDNVNSYHEEALVIEPGGHIISSQLYDQGIMSINFLSALVDSTTESSLEVYYQPRYESNWTSLGNVMVEKDIVDGITVEINRFEPLKLKLMNTGNVPIFIDNLIINAHDYDDTTSPHFKGIEENYVIDQGESFNPLEEVIAIDNIDGNLTTMIDVTVVDEHGTPLSPPVDYTTLDSGYYGLIYTVDDTSGNQTTNYSVLNVDGAITMHETFENFEGNDTSYVSESFDGVGDFTWDVTNSRKNLGGYEIDGGGIMFRVPGTIEAIIPGGIQSLSLDILMGFTGGAPEDRTIEVYINDQFIDGHTLSTTTVETLIIEDIAIEGTFTIRFEASGVSGRQITINNFIWSTDATNQMPHYLLDLSSNLESATLTQSEVIIEKGDTVSISARDASGEETFMHWVDQEGTIVSEMSNYSFEVNAHTALKAVFSETIEDKIHSITLESNIDDAPIFVSPDEPLFADEESVSINAGEKEGHRFEYWIDQDFDLALTTNASHAFEITRNRTFKAIYIEDNKYELYINSNAEAFTISRDQMGPYDSGEVVTLTPSTADNYYFTHWYNYFEDEIVSTDEVLTLTVEDSMHLVAIYETLSDPEKFYETGFEDSTKTSYNDGVVIADDKEWFFKDTLIGTLDNDLKEGNRSARIRDGSIETSFAVNYIHEVSFLYGKFGSDSNQTISLQVSNDQINWIEIETFFATDTLQAASVDGQTIYDATPFDIDESVYLRIEGSRGSTQRVNIDNIVIYNQSMVTPDIPQALLGDELHFPNNSERLTMDLTVDNYYSYGDLWEPGTCIVTDTVTGDTLDCAISGALNTDNLGRQEVIYYAVDSEGKYISEVVEKVVFTDATLLDLDFTDVADGYYTGIEGLYGEALRNALQDIITTNITYQSYDAARDILQETDQDPQNPDNIILIYTRLSVPSGWDGGETWNREHVWPNNRFPGDRTSNLGSDLHNLAPADPGENSSRGYKYFTDTTTSDTYNPHDDVKGDVARMMFYMDVLYDSLTLVEGFANADDDEMGDLMYLIEWHFIDTVNVFEENRNNIIYSYQNNRNPFIDIPELVELLWYDHPSLPLD